LGKIKILHPPKNSISYGYAKVSFIPGGGATQPVPRDGGWWNSTETQKSGHTPWSGPEVKNGRSSANHGVLEWLKRGTIQEEVS